MEKIFITDEPQLRVAINTILDERESKKKQEFSDRLYTINQIAKRLGKAHGTIKKAVTNGLIKSTVDGLITEAAINEYLQKS